MEKASFLLDPFSCFERCALRTAGQRIALAAQEQRSAIPYLFAIRSIYGDKVASFGSFLGYRKERLRFRNFL